MNRTFPDSGCIGTSVACIAGDGIVQGDPLNPVPNGELLNANPNLAFGQPIINTFLDDDFSHGWGDRAANWEFTSNVQHELAPNVSVDFGYFRRAWINFSVLDDRTLSASDFDRFQVLVPNDARLGSAAGRTITLLDRKPTASASPQNYWTSVNEFGGWDQIYNGFDLTIDARVNKVLLQGGMNIGRTETDRCSLAANVPETQLLQNAPGANAVVPWGPVGLEDCATKQNWLTQVKLIGSYTLPYDVQVAATYQDQPGPERQARVVFSAAQIAAVLGRPAGPRPADGQRPDSGHGLRRPIPTVRPAVHEELPRTEQPPLTRDVRPVQPVQPQHCRAGGTGIRRVAVAAAGDHAGTAGEVRVPARFLRTIDRVAKLRLKPPSDAPRRGRRIFATRRPLAAETKTASTKAERDETLASLAATWALEDV